MFFEDTAESNKLTMIGPDVRESIEKSVLCWLATANRDNEPNVSPKEVFAYQDERTLLIAHIASPQSVLNIEENPNVCVSFVDIFVQKGFKLKGRATLINRGNYQYEQKARLITDLFGDQYPIRAIIEVIVTKVESIQAPSYFLYPNRTEESQIRLAMKSYQVKPLDAG